MRTYTTAELAELPTLFSAHFDDLKVDTGTERIWLTRMTPEDGAQYQIHHEEYKNSEWMASRSYAPFLEV